MKVYQKKITTSNLEWSLKKLSIILQPFVPHISEEIWQILELKPCVLMKLANGEGKEN